MPEPVNQNLMARTPSLYGRTLGFLLAMLAVILVSRLITMALVPLPDTTEARYGEIARLMVVTNDWITPWFKPGVPFWGKPPLSFWAQALSLKVLGWQEFAPRFPSWLAQIAMIWLIARYARGLVGRRGALLTALVFSSSGLAFVCAGAVLTDPFLALGTTAALVGAGLALRGEGRVWGWVFFLGLTIGLLAKGPLTLVLVGGPLFLWMLWSRRWVDLWRRIPWITGTIVMLLLSVPWYVAAELKTPGFIDYFIVGEHIKRFLDPGWKGDLYGSAHEQPHGMIWLMTFYATLPWSPLALVALIPGLRRRGGKMGRPLLAALRDDDNRLLLLSAFMPSLFFTLSGNILATYVLPGLPFMALLMVRGMGGLAVTRQWFARLFWPLCLFVPVVTLVAGVYVHQHPDRLRSEKQLVACYRMQPDRGETPLTYVDDAPFSARYYSQEKVRHQGLDKVAMEIKARPEQPVYVAVRAHDLDALHQRVSMPLIRLFEDRRFILVTQKRDAAVACP